MKHLFLVHSPVTFLSAVSVINALNLNNGNAVIIFFQFEKIVSTGNTYSTISINEVYSDKSLLKRTWYYFRYFNVIKRIDRVIELAIQDEKFTAYVPALVWAGKVLITNKNCVAFNFIEEGLAHYFNEETLRSLTPVNSANPWRSSILKNTKLVLKEMYEVLRGYNFRLQALPFSYSCYHAFKNVRYYGFSKNSFPLANADKRVVVDFEKESFSHIKQKINYDLSDAVIWIGDGGVFQHGLNSSVYLKGIEDGCIPFIQQHHYKKCFIKFHRDETPVIRATVKNLFSKNNILFEVIPDSVILELLLFKATNATLIGVYSSLLYYAAIMNHAAFSIYNFLKAEYAKIIADRDFSFFWNKVKLMNAETTITENADRIN